MPWQTVFFSVFLFGIMLLTESHVSINLAEVVTSKYKSWLAGARRSSIVALSRCNDYCEFSCPHPALMPADLERQVHYIAIGKLSMAISFSFAKCTEIISSHSASQDKMRSHLLLVFLCLNSLASLYF